MPVDDPLLTRLQAQLRRLTALEDAGPAIAWPPLPPASATTTTWRERLIDAPQRRQAALARHSDGGPMEDDEALTRRRRRAGPRPPREDAPTGETIRQARAVSGLSQRALAKARHISRSWLADIERGRRGVPPELAVWATLTLTRQGQQR